MEQRMILCGSITDPELRRRLTLLAEGKGWDSWITHEATLLRPMLDALGAAPDAIVSDDRPLLERLDEFAAARILLAETTREDPELFVVGVGDDDRALLQHLYDCINATRLRSRVSDGRHREPITQLPRHQQLVCRLREHDGKPVALLVVQVDHAEHLYANLDPVSRTDLLEALATRFKLSVPETGTIGFYDAGCFIVVLPELSADALMRTAEDIRTAARNPLRYSGGEIHLTVSIGCNHVAAYEHFDELWQGAWRAVNRALKQGGNRTDGGPTDHISSRLPTALERDEFGLMLQGQWSGERLTGVEALLRWQGLEVGELAPSHFIAVAEREGFITRIGDWVLEHASSTATSWLEHLVQPLLLGINVSPQQFVNNAITRQIERLRGERWLDPAMLELELSQENLLILVDQHRDQLYRLRDWGVRFAIDNLGTELINFDKLLRCPADTLKIDRSLVAKVCTHAASRELVSEIAGIGERFGLRVVAVGVEAPEQLDTLSRLGDMDVQGYLLSPPVPIGEFHQLLSPGPELEQEL
jgi:EAL domain-containing protein (putative c-di-GMP-specific phosphodiesterase class I)/GGDEF domain-containing protein